MKIKRINYYGFDHKAIYKRFNCTKYLGDIAVNGEYQPSAIYHAPNHDKKKGHKEYVLLQVINGQILVRGMTKEQITPYSNVVGIKCFKCNTVIYSTFRHHMQGCDCNSESVVYIDGGRDYTKTSMSSKSIFKYGIVNLLTRKFK